MSSASCTVAAGVLVRTDARPDLEAQSLDSATLQTRIEFDLPSSTDEFASYAGFWSIPDATTVYGIKGVVGEDGLSRATLMRFDIASPGADILFANGFE